MTEVNKGYKTTHFTLHKLNDRPLHSSNIVVVYGKDADAVYELNTKQVYRINHSAGEILRLCDGNHTIDDIAKEIFKTANVDSNKIRKDVLNFISSCPSDWLSWNVEDSRRENAGGFFSQVKTEQLRQVSWECTFVCNLRCLHCLVDAGGSIAGELNADEAMHLIDQFADAGVKTVSLTGGEVTLRRDFFDIVRRINWKGMELNVLTNGTTMNNKIAQCLRNADAKVQVSILGSNSIIHDYLTGVDGSLEKALQGIRTLLQEGVKLLDVSFVTMASNIKDIQNVRKQMAELGLGVKAGLLLPLGRAKSNWDYLGLKPEHFLALRREPMKMHEVLQGNLGVPQFGSIPCPVDSMTVTPTGDAILCSGLRDPVLGNVRDFGVAEIWNGVKSFLRTLSVDNVNICRNCEFRYACMGACRAVTLAYKQVLTEKNPLCELY